MSYAVRFVDPGRSYRAIRAEVDSAYAEVMLAGDLVDRRHLRQFEENLARFVGTRYAVGVNSGFDALHVSLRALGVGPGDEVIVPAHTFVATASAVVHAGAQPVLVDVGRDFNIVPERAEEAVSPRTAAIVPVHLNGRMADMERIMDIAGRHDLAVVEDACQSLGAELSGRPAGSIGDTGCWSFYPFKILGGYGDGGAITTDDEAVATFARRMRFNGEDRATGELHGHGFTCLLDNLQAAWLDVKLRHLPRWIKRRQEVAARYHQAFGDLRWLGVPRYSDPRYVDVFQNYVVRVAAGDRFVDHLRRSGIEVLVQWRKPYYKYAALGLEDLGFTETETLSREVCSLPLHPDLSDDEVEQVVAAVRSFRGD